MSVFSAEQSYADAFAHQWLLIVYLLYCEMEEKQDKKVFENIKTKYCMILSVIRL